VYEGKEQKTVSIYTC